MVAGDNDDDADGIGRGGDLIANDGDGDAAAAVVIDVLGRGAPRGCWVVSNVPDVKRTRKKSSGFGPRRSQQPYTLHFTAAHDTREPLFHDLNRWNEAQGPGRGEGAKSGTRAGTEMHSMVVEALSVLDLHSQRVGFIR